jgi:hypothetical protein
MSQPEQNDSHEMKDTEAKLTLEQRIDQVEKLLKWLLTASGLSLAMIVGVAFWLGGMSTKVSDSSMKVDKIYAVVLENKDSLASRTSVIETKLDVIDKKVTDLSARPLQGRVTSSVRPLK